MTSVKKDSKNNHMFTTGEPAIHYGHATPITLVAYAVIKLVCKSLIFWHTQLAEVEAILTLPLFRT